MLQEKDIERLADLCKLEISTEDLPDYTREISRMMELVQKLQEVDTEGIVPTFHGNQNINVYREDIAEDSHLDQAMLANAPDSQDGFIRVPVIIESGEA